MLFLSVSGPFVTTKGSLWHIWIGRVFVAAWLVHLLDGLVNAIVILVSRGYHERNYPSEGFSMYLYIQFGLVSSILVDYLVHGLASLQYKLEVGCVMRANATTLM